MDWQCYLPHLRWRASAHKKEKPCFDTQRNEVSGFPDESHIYKRLQTYVPFLLRFSKMNLTYVVYWFYSCEEDNNTELVYTAHVCKNILDP